MIFRCLHCGSTELTHRARGLCQPCYRQPEVRALFPRSRKCRRGIPDGFFFNPAQEATGAMPGSIDKVDVLCARAERRESLWHPLDARAL